MMQSWVCGETWRGYNVFFFSTMEAEGESWDPVKLAKAPVINY